jgi:hypothetical protein
MLWFWWTRFDELIYHTVGDNQLIELGDATTFSEKSEQTPLNSYVSVTGILGNKAATLSGLRAGAIRFGRYQVRHLLGSKLYVEFDEEKYKGRYTPFTRVAIQGRLVPFGPGSELEKVRVFFKDYYSQPVDDKAMLIVVDETPRSQPIYALLFVLSLGMLGLSIFSTVRMFQRPPIEKDQDDLE